MATVQEQSLEPVPNQQPLVEGDTKPMSYTWTQWFTNLRTKVNTISAALVQIATNATAGFLASDGAGGINARTLVAGTGINITNPTGATGNPTINASSTGGNPMEVTTNTAATYIVPLTAAPAGTGNVGWVDSNNAGTNYIQIDVNANQAFPIGTSLFVRQLGAGQTNLEALTGVTFQGSPTAGGQYAVGRLVQIAINTWAVFGNLATVTPNYATVILADGPVGYWHLGETSGTVAADSSGGGHNATYAGTYTLGETSLLPHGYGKSFYSAAAADIALPSGFVTTVKSPLTIEGWLKVASFSNSPSIFTTYNGGWSFGFNTSGQMEVSNPGVALLATDTTVLAVNTVYYVAVTWDASGNVLFYVNGTLSSTHTGVSVAGYGVDPAFIAAYNTSNNRMNGNLQEIALYNKILTPTQIASHYAAG